MKTYEEVIDLVEQWGEDKGIIGIDGKATVSGQLDKLDEEIKELKDAILNGDLAEVEDAAGDIQVVLILLLRILENQFVATITMTDSLQGAYNVISKRTGKMVGGQFIKD